MKVKVLVALSCPTCCDPMDCSPPGSSVFGILQARILKWVAIFFSNDQPRQHIKSRDITLLAKVCIVKAMVFSMVMYGCESWTIKKAEDQFNAFE